jgi:hypothetical protein
MDILCANHENSNIFVLLGPVLSCFVICSPSFDRAAAIKILVTIRIPSTLRAAIKLRNSVLKYL